MSEELRREAMRAALGVDELLAVMADADALANSRQSRIFIVPTSWQRDHVMMKLVERIEKAGYEVRKHQLLEVRSLEVKRLEVIAVGCQPFERKAQWKREQGFGRGRRRMK